MEPVSVKCRCPRCRANDLLASETTEAIMQFDISNGTMTRINHSDEFGDIIGVRLECMHCGHAWKPRGVTNIMQLEEPTHD